MEKSSIAMLDYKKVWDRIIQNWGWSKSGPQIAWHDSEMFMAGW